MTTDLVLESPPVPTRPYRRARWGTVSTFAVNGLLIGSFASRIPALKSTLGLSDSTLGRVLFASAIGSLTMLQFAGKIVKHWGSRTSSYFGAVLCGVGLTSVGSTDRVPVAVVSLFVLGTGFSLIDVAMNSQAVLVEQRYRRPIMSSFHAAFSLGALGGAALGGLLVRAGLSQPHQYVGTAAVTFVLLVVSIAAMVGDDTPLVTPAMAEDHHETDRPTRSAARTVMIFGAIAFAGMLSEGAAADWSGVHLRDTIGWVEADAARGFIVFQIFMTLGRLFGDRVVARLGPRRTLISSAAIAGVGFGAGLASERGWPFVAGLGALGIGLALVVPVVFSAATAQAGDTGHAIARVSSIGYAGFLVGPPLIGQLAQWTSTTVALGLLPGLAAASVVLTIIAVPSPSGTPVSSREQLA